MRGRAGVGATAKTVAESISIYYKRNRRYLLLVLALLVAGPLLAAYVGGADGALLGTMVDYTLAAAAFLLHRRAETKVEKIVKESA